MKKNDTRLIYNRIKKAYGLKTDIELVDFIAITPQVIPTPVARGTVQWDKIFQKYEYWSIDWLRTGIGEMMLNPSKTDGECNVCAEKDRLTVKTDKLLSSQEKLIEKFEQEIEKLNTEVSEIKKHSGIIPAKNAAVVSAG